jgi:predicted SAM-dependent methyltransferase
MISLHLGCGKRYLSEFTYHVDLADYPHVTHRRDISNLLCFETNSVDLIYCCHALPYYDRFEVVHVLKEWRRVLKSGGTLRLAVSDFEAWTQVYLKYHRLNMVLGALYGRWEIGNTDKIIYEKTAYDYDSLKELLDDNGFCNYRRYDAIKFLNGRDDHSLAFIPHYRECKTIEEYLSGFITSLNVECDKL